MKINTRTPLYIMISSLFIIVFSLSGCSSTAELQSGWDAGAVKIDGNISDWENGLHPVKDEGVSLGFKNDDKYLYICLVTNDRAKIMQMMRAGFIVWFTPQSGNPETFGIKYPMPPSLLGKDERESFNKELYQRGSRDNVFDKMLKEKKEFQIINTDDFPLGQYPINNNIGIKPKLSFNDERFVYELKVPLTSGNNNMYSLGSKPGEELSIKFETVEMDLESMRGLGNRGGMRPGNGMGNEGSENEGRGGFGRGRGNGGFAKSEPFNYSVNIRLNSSQK